MELLFEGTNSNFSVFNKYFLDKNPTGGKNVVWIGHKIDLQKPKDLRVVRNKLDIDTYSLDLKKVSF